MVIKARNIAKPTQPQIDKKIISNIDNEVALELKSFSKRYSRNKHYSVKGASFKIYKGSFHGFIGANGAGKTTTIKSIIGAYAKYEGDVFIYGDNNKTKSAKKHIGYIPEAASFPDGFGTLAYLKNMAILSGMTAKKAEEFARAELQKLGLSSVARRNPNKLSSGQKKKVLLAQALIHQPDVLIMDEPAANLDPTARTDFFNQLTRLQKAGITIFISSHILDELQKYVDSLTIIDGGKIVFSGKLEDINNQKDASKNKWSLRVLDPESIKSIFAKLKIKVQEKSGTFFFTVSDLELQNIFAEVLKAKIVIISLKSTANDLISIYENYVKLGSLDTGGEQNV